MVTMGFGLTAAGLGTTPLNATNLTSGTVPDARLSANVPLKNGNNVYTGTNAYPNINLSGSPPQLLIADTAQAVGNKVFLISNQMQAVYVQAMNDAGTLVTGGAMNFSRLGVLTVSGGLGTTPLDATQLTSGTVADARLSSNVALRNAANAFTGQNVFSNANYLEYASPQLVFSDTAQPANLKRFRLVDTIQRLYLQAVDDTFTTASGTVYMDRVGNLFVEQNILAANAFPWTDVPFSSANYTTNTGVLSARSTRRRTSIAYTIIGKTLVLMCTGKFGINNGVTNEIRFAMPGGVTPNSMRSPATENQAGIPAHYIALNSNLSALALAFIDPSDRYVSVQRADGVLGAMWPNGDAVIVRFIVEIPLA